ncbi:hypothetical protein G6F70_007667 [Rhizopus microsporus]|nr:hypothetical protein G6F71_008613 [Rhizopus microsporus]KAG1196142.1 hypothetical protein G6F70_007667 [Rhizopus microsporus]KAG1229724.1 hypothetical protein G6F67_006943 [Rhizopus microsporus]KAG1259030.1 hypothetical protein G6F68_008398 [Rhizopus microsporus]
MNTKPRWLTCNSCFNQDLENLKRGEGGDVKKIHQVLKCKSCNIFWNRDAMAAKNMLTIARSIWNDHGRPNVFKRQLATSNVVTSFHSTHASNAAAPKNPASTLISSLPVPPSLTSPSLTFETSSQPKPPALRLPI